MKCLKLVCGKRLFAGLPRRPSEAMTKHRMKPSFLSDLPSCPSTFSAAHLVTINVSPLWLRASVAVKMSSLPRYEIDRLIKERLVKVAWRPNKAGTRHPLIYAPSLWAVMDEWAGNGESLPQTGPAEEEKEGL